MSPDHPEMPSPRAPLNRQPGEAILAGNAAPGRGSDTRAQISSAMVALKKRFYGKGPDRARSYLVDEYVFCAMEGGLTRNEETLVEAGEEQAVRDYRLLFQSTMAPTTTEAIEQLVGRRVIGYHSQITFRPTRAFEIFVLGDQFARDPSGGSQLPAP
jgi:uncharacterized protein YbcI